MLWTSGPGQAHHDYSYTNFYLTNDSIELNDTVYRKLYYSNDTIFNSQKKKFYKYLCEINNKVFIGDTFQNMQLVLDYNLNVSDSFCFNADTPFWLNVKSVDSIMVGELKRKRITFESLPGRQDLIWIEGLGDITYGQHFSGYQTLIQWSFFYEGLDCYSENNEYLWGTNCRLTSINEGKDKETRYLIYPNPTNGIFKIELIENRLIKYNLYNCKGILIKSDLLSKENEINISDLSNGFYFLQLEGNKKGNYKIIKK